MVALVQTIEDIIAAQRVVYQPKFTDINYITTALPTYMDNVDIAKLLREYEQIASFTSKHDQGYQLSECRDLIVANKKVTYIVAGNCSLEAAFIKASCTIIAKICYVYIVT